MEYLIGVGLAAAVYVFAMVSDSTRRVFYPRFWLWLGITTFVCGHGKFHAGARAGISGSGSVSGTGGDRLQGEPLADCGRSRGDTESSTSFITC